MVRLVRGDCPVVPFGERPSANAVQCSAGEGASNESDTQQGIVSRVSRDHCHTLRGYRSRIGRQSRNAREFVPNIK